MNRGLRLVLMLGFVGPAPAAAQPIRESHVPVPRTIDMRPRDLLRAQLRSSDAAANFEVRDHLSQLAKLASAYGDPQGADRLANRLLTDHELRALLQNPEFQHVVRRIRDGDLALANRLSAAATDFPLSVLSRETIVDFARSLIPLMPKQAGSGPPQVPPVINTAFPRDVPHLQSDRSPPALAGITTAGLTSGDRDFANRLKEWLRDLNMDDLPEGLRDSEVLQDLVRSISDFPFDGRAALPDGWQRTLPQFENVLSKIGEAMRTNWPSGLKIKWPNLPRVNLRFNPPDLSSVPRFSSPSFAASGWWELPLGILGILILGFVFWKLFTRQHGLLGVGQAKKLGPWPVDPGAVSTRQEVIQAFEYLALLLFGEPARHWHHRRVAARLREKPEADPIAADHLATLYEQARYSPENEPAELWSAARQPLAQLAKAGAA